VEPLVRVGVHVPAVDHALVEPEDPKERLPGDQLEIPRRIHAHVGMGDGDLVQVKRLPELIAGLDDGGRILAGEGLPQRVW
jgi:hypothetical protein